MQLKSTIKQMMQHEQIILRNRLNRIIIQSNTKKFSGRCEETFFSSFFFLKNWSLDNSGSFFQIFDISKPQAGFYSHTDAAQMTDPTEAHYFYFLESLSHTRGNGPYWLFVCKRYLPHPRPSPWVVTEDHVIWEREPIGKKKKKKAACCKKSQLTLWHLWV